MWKVGIIFLATLFARKSLEQFLCRRQSRILVTGVLHCVRQSPATTPQAQTLPLYGIRSDVQEFQSKP